MHRNCLLKHVIEGKIEGRTEVTGRRGRWCKQLLHALTEKSEYWKLKEEALDRSQWRTRFGRGYRPVVRQTAEWMNLSESFGSVCLSEMAQVRVQSAYSVRNVSTKSVCFAGSSILFIRMVIFKVVAVCESATALFSHIQPLIYAVVSFLKKWGVNKKA
jgi:hypothetical protein